MIDQERIIRIAKKSGINLTPAQFSGVLEDEIDEFQLEHFAKLLLSEECEACAQIADISEPYQSADKIRERKKMYETL